MDGFSGASIVVPDVAEHVVGYRAWDLQRLLAADGERWMLRSLNGQGWRAGEDLEAVCLAGDRYLGAHAVPSEQPHNSGGHGCGIYAFKTLPGLIADLHFGSGMRSLYQPRYVVGTVHLWGRCIEHEGGWRGQFARVGSIIDIDDELASRLKCHCDRCVEEMSARLRYGSMFVQSSMSNLTWARPAEATVAAYYEVPLDKVESHIPSEEIDRRWPKSANPFTPPSRYQHRLADITKTLAETSTLTVYTSPKKSRLKKLRTAAGAVIRNIWEPLAMASAVSAGVSGELGWWWVGAMCVWLSSHLVYRRSAQKRREP